VWLVDVKSGASPENEAAITPLRDEMFKRTWTQRVSEECRTRQISFINTLCNECSFDCSCEPT